MSIIDVSHTLKSLISQYGFPTHTNDRQYISLIKDIFVDSPRDMNLLIVSIEEGIPEKIRELKDTVSFRTLSESIINQLIHTRGMDYDAAQWIFQTWTITLGITEPPNISPVSNRSQNEQSNVTKKLLPIETIANKPEIRRNQKEIKNPNYAKIGVIILIIIAILILASIFSSSNFITETPGDSISPTNSPVSTNSDYWFKYGMSKIDEEDYSGAINAFDKELIANPNDAKILAFKGYALLKDGRIREAYTIEDQATIINPYLPEAWNYKGLALDKMGKYQEALFASNKALSLDSQSKEYWITNGDILSHLNQWKNALISYTNAYQLSSSDPTILGMRKMALSQIFTCSDKKLMTGDGYKNFLIESCEECEMACAMDPSCVAFTYTTSSKSDRYCDLKNQVSDTVRDDNSISGYLKKCS